MSLDLLSDLFQGISDGVNSPPFIKILGFSNQNVQALQNIDYVVDSPSLHV